jgi:hypothetical protein
MNLPLARSLLELPQELDDRFSYPFVVLGVFVLVFPIWLPLIASPERCGHAQYSWFDDRCAALATIFITIPLVMIRAPFLVRGWPEKLF